MNLILSFLAKLFGGIFSDWLEEMQKMDEAEKKGALEAQLKQKEIDDARIAEAGRARDRADLVDHRVPDDPDFRD